MDGHLEFLKNAIIKSQDRATIEFKTMKIIFVPCLKNVVVLQVDIITSALPEFRYNTVRSISNMDGILGKASESI